MADTSETSPTGSKPFYILLRRPDISSVLGNVATTARPITTLDVKLCNLIWLQVLPHNRAVTRTTAQKKEGPDRRKGTLAVVPLFPVSPMFLGLHASVKEN